MNHDQLLAEVIGLADILGIWWIHLPAQFHGPGPWKGFPDLMLLGDGGLLFAEIKTGSRLEPAQVLWRDRLRSAGEQWRLWQPADWLIGNIRAELSELARRPG